MKQRERPRTLIRTVVIGLLLAAPLLARAQQLRLPLKQGSLRFAIIGDTGTASREQLEVGVQMKAYHDKFPFEFVIMLGDNIYGGQTPADMVAKFETPYKALSDAGVKFFASLGNHDNPTQRDYKAFNMGGQRYYSFKPQQGIRFFALDSNYMDKPQLEWLEKELAGSGSEWKICFFHHPLYSSGRTHGSALDLRALLEPLFIKYGVDVVFSGHDHFYERIIPQHGIHYFVSGAGGSLRRGDIRKTPMTAVGYDKDFHFMLAEIEGENLHYQAISRTADTVDAGVIQRRPKTEGESAGPIVPSGTTPKTPAVSPPPDSIPSPGAKATPSPSPKPTPTPTPTPKPSPPR